MSHVQLPHGRTKKSFMFFGVLNTNKIYTKYYVQVFHVPIIFFTYFPISLGLLWHPCCASRWSLQHAFGIMQSPSGYSVLFPGVPRDFSFHPLQAVESTVVHFLLPKGIFPWLCPEYNFPLCVLWVPHITYDIQPNFFKNLGYELCHQ